MNSAAKIRKSYFRLFVITLSNKAIHILFYLTIDNNKEYIDFSDCHLKPIGRSLINYNEYKVQTTFLIFLFNSSMPKVKSCQFILVDCLDLRKQV